jgi:FKBP-type peptidyl-prolyl cis-trans isomerase (trigger factor)
MKYAIQVQAATEPGPRLPREFTAERLAQLSKRMRKQITSEVHADLEASIRREVEDSVHSQTIHQIRRHLPQEPMDTRISKVTQKLRVALTCELTLQMGGNLSNEVVHDLEGKIRRETRKALMPVIRDEVKADLTQQWTVAPELTPSIEEEARAHLTKGI